MQQNLLAGKDERAVSYPPIPSVVFTLPQLSSVGLSKPQHATRGWPLTRISKRPPAGTRRCGSGRATVPTRFWSRTDRPYSWCTSDRPRSGGTNQSLCHGYGRRADREQDQGHHLRLSQLCVGHQFDGVADAARLAFRLRASLKTLDATGSRVWEAPHRQHTIVSNGQRPYHRGQHEQRNVPSQRFPTVERLSPARSAGLRP